MLVEAAESGPGGQKGWNLTFGPVPSRRLGRSLGVNNIPPKLCSYSCVYCQLGSASEQRVERRPIYGAAEVVGQVNERVRRARETREKIDYLTFVPDGEPTLDPNLGKEIDSLKTVGIKIAVITNSSLAWREDVREELARADWVSMKVDAVTDSIWKRINRPHHSLKLESILNGMRDFSESFKGELTTETMLVKEVNDSEDEVRRVAEFLTELKPGKSYIAIPTRPPAVDWVKAPNESTVNVAYQLFKEKLANVELLTGYEGNEFVSTGNIEEDLLGITSVHPMRKDAVERLLSNAAASWETVDRLLRDGKMKEAEFEGKKFYLRRFGHIYTE